MGTGAFLSYELIPASTRHICNKTPSRPTPSSSASVRDESRRGKRALQQIAAAVSATIRRAHAVLYVQRPAEIVNYRSMRITPLYLGSALAAGAMFALALTLVASVRRRPTISRCSRRSASRRVNLRRSSMAIVRCD